MTKMLHLKDEHFHVFVCEPRDLGGNLGETKRHQRMRTYKEAREVAQGFKRDFQAKGYKVMGRLTRDLKYEVCKKKSEGGEHVATIGIYRCVRFDCIQKNW